ncbi:hypothetical protein DL93DRAFT_2078895 [Clavulina sp. PMI_390]|nr:hypothetical protein DL93DRAFT_2078895 [Clavulina sp. PMI_390]
MPFTHFTTSASDGPSGIYIGSKNKSLPYYRIKTTTDAAGTPYGCTTILREEHRIALIEWKKGGQTSITFEKEVDGNMVETRELLGKLFVSGSWL